MMNADLSGLNNAKTDTFIAANLN